MAIVHDVDPEELRAWLADRPQVIKDLAARCPPGRLYWLKSSGHRVTLVSYCKDGTITVLVSGQYNRVAFERQVFGITPDELVECELPGPDEPVGAALTECEDIERHLEEVRRRDRGQTGDA